MRSGKPAKPVSYLKVRFEKDQEIFVILQMIAPSKAAYFSGNSKCFSGKAAGSRTGEGL